MWPFNKKVKTIKAQKLDNNGWPVNLVTGVGDDISPENKSRTKLRSEAYQIRYNPYVEKYVSICESIILGSHGFILDMNVQNSNGSVDTGANKLIEDGIKLWKNDVSACGRFNLRELIAVLIREQRISGEVFLWKQIIDGELKYVLLKSEDIDDDYEVPQNRIFAGIKYDGYNKPLSYYKKTTKGRLEIPATDIKHIFKSKVISDYRGVTSIAPVINSLSKLSKFNKASLDQHIIAASHTVVFQQTGAEGGDFNESYDLNDDGTPKLKDDKDGNYIKTLNSKEIGFVPEGHEAKSLDLGNSKINASDFIKDVLKEVASGLLIPHHALSSDLAESSYSSLKFNSIFEQAHWASIQMLFVEVYRSIIVDVITHLILTKKIMLPSSKIEKFTTSINVLGYKIPDLEPNKMAVTNKTNLELGLTTHTEILAKTNRTVVDVLEEKLKEQELEKQYGIKLNDVINNDNMKD